MGTWIKETGTAFYLMEGGYYLSKISKYPSQNNPNEQVVNISGMKSWFTRADFPGGMTISTQEDAPEPLPKPEAIAPSPAPQPEPIKVPTPPAPVAPKRINTNGLLLIKSFEGLRLNAYRDAVGIWTIGYGTTRGVKPGMRISEAEAEKFLQEDLTRFEQAIHEALSVSINDNQFSSLVSFTYNIGSGAFRSSTLLRLLNQGEDVRSVGAQFLRWDKAGGKVLAGLTRRRNAERSLFLGENFRSFLSA